MKQKEEKLWAVAAHLGSLIFPFTALIVFLVFKDRSRYVGHHAYQAMWFFFTAWIAGLVLSVLPLIGKVLVGALTLVVIGCAVVAAVNALAGHYWEYPIIGRIWRRALGNS
jgi:uncharacterized membrane protein